MGGIVPHTARRCFFFLVAILPPAVLGQSYTISTAVGAGAPSNVQSKSTSLGLGVPSFLTADSAGNIYFVDQNSVIEMNAATGLLTVVAGNGTTGYSGDSGPATGAQFNNPLGLALDSNGALYIADSGNNAIRKVSGGVITTIAGTGVPGSNCANGSAASAQLNSPTGVAADTHGNLFIVDSGDSCVRELSGATITTIAGSGSQSFGGNIGDGGPATSATFGHMQGVAVDSTGNVYIADAGDLRIREVNASTHIISTVAGTGVYGTFGGDGGAATAAALGSPLGVAVDSQGNLYITDAVQNVVREVSSGVIHTAAGDGLLPASFSGDGTAATQARLSSPQMVALDGAGNLYIADQAKQSHP